MNSSSSGLELEGVYPFSISHIAERPTAEEFVALDKHNEKLLRTSASWQDSSEVEELDAVSLELRRQDMKINLIMEMVSELLMQQSELPAKETIKLTPSCIEFQSSQDRPGVGELAKATLYILPAIPKALEFFGEVRTSEKENTLKLDFQGTGKSVQDQIEKLLFTHHRRSIALVHASNQDAKP